MHQILPAAIRYSSDLSDGIIRKQNATGGAVTAKTEVSLVSRISQRIDSLYEKIETLYSDLKSVPAETDRAMAYYSDVVVPAMAEIRKDADFLEKLTAKSYWPYPTYSDILFY